MEYDVIVIGCGVVGAAIARELSKYELTILVLEKHVEVCAETSKANSGIIHGGYDAKPGTLKAELNVLGNKRVRETARTLDLCFQQTGSLVVSFSPEEDRTIEELYERGQLVKSEGLEIWNKDSLLQHEPNLSANVSSALYCSSAGIICPFDMTYAGIENALENGAELVTQAAVTDIKKKAAGGYEIHTAGGIYTAPYVINAAGLYSDKIAGMAGDTDFTILPRKGEYRILDKSYTDIVKRVIFQAPSKMGKGILVSPTAHGNILVGPTAQNIDNIYDVTVTTEGLAYMDTRARKSVPNLDIRKTIRVFTGVRARPSTGDFMIYESKHSPGIIHAGGIESPGLSSSFAIGEYVVHLLENAGARLVKKASFNPFRRRIQGFSSLDTESQQNLIKKTPAYGHVICRCETVTEGEIIEAIHRPAGARTVDGVKRRVRPGSGRCQGGFCAPRVMEILSRELSIPMEEIVKDTAGGHILTGVK